MTNFFLCQVFSLKYALLEINPKSCVLLCASDNTSIIKEKIDEKESSDASQSRLKAKIALYSISSIMSDSFLVI